MTVLTARGTLPPIIYLRHKQIQLRKVRVKGEKRFFAYAQNDKAAFTLVEVLITLGIIGVVAAITIPGVIHKVRAVQFQAQFKAAASIVENATLNTFRDISDVDFIKRPGVITSFVSDTEKAAINEYFKSLLPVQATLTLKLANKGDGEFADKVNSKPLFRKDGRRYGYYYIYNLPCNNKTGIGSQVWILNNGMAVSPISFQTHGLSDGIKVCIDINGPLSGPNRFGWDLFIYDTGGWNRHDCTKWNYGCYDMAKKDLNSYFSTLRR